MKNICLVIRGLNGGGIETVSINLANKLLANNCDVTIVLLSKSNYTYDIDARISIVYLDEYTNSIPGILSRLINKVFPLLGSFLFSHYFSKKFESYTKESKIKFDKIVLCGFGAYSVLSKSRISGLEVQCHNTNSLLLAKKSNFFIYFTKLIYQYFLNGHHVTCVSTGIKMDLETKFRLNLKSLKVVYNLIDSEKLNLLKEECISIPDKFIVHVGRFVPEKNQKILIDSFAKIPLDLRPKLVFIGDGPLLLNCKKYVSELSLSDDIMFTGFIKNPYPYINKALFLVLCSRHEGLPTVLLESLFLGTYVISSDCPSGPSEIVTPINNGVLFPVDDQSALLDEMSYCLKSKNHMNSIKPHSKFSPENVLKHYLD